MLRFKGTFTEQRQFFIDTWRKLAKENERLALFEDSAGTARQVPRPPLPEIDEDATQRENEILCVSHERVEKALNEGEKLTLEDCFAIDEAVGAELRCEA